VILGLFFTYFVIFWTIVGVYGPVATNAFPLLMAVLEIQHLGNVGGLLICRNSEVSEALHRLQLSRNVQHEKVVKHLHAI